MRADGDGLRTAGVAIEAAATSRALHDPKARFMSIATYRFPTKDASGRARFSRAETEIVGVDSASLDLDYYNGPLAHLSVERIAEMVIHAVDEAGLPRLSEIIATGQGLRIVWKFTRQVPRTALPRWRAAVRSLAGEEARPTRKHDPADVVAARGSMQRRFDLLRPFCPDKSAMDPTRVFRIVGSINEKNGEAVRLLKSTGAVHQFDEFCDEVLPLTRERLKEVRAGSRSRREDRGDKHTHDRAPVTRLTSATRWQTVVNDLMKWCAGQPGGRPGPKQKRLWLFHLTNALAQVDTEAAVDDLAFENHLAAGVLARRHALNSVQAVRTRRGREEAGEVSHYGGEERSLMYGYRGRTIAENLGIDAAEARRLDLRIVIPVEVRKERAAARSQEYRERNGAIPRASTRSRRDEIGCDAARLRAEEDLSNVAIAHRLGCSEALVRKALKERTATIAPVSAAPAPPTEGAGLARFVTVSVGSPIQSEGSGGEGSGEGASPAPISARPRGLAALRIVEADDPEPPRQPSPVPDDDTMFDGWFMPDLVEPSRQLSRPMPPTRHIDTGEIIPEPPKRRWHSPRRTRAERVERRRLREEQRLEDIAFVRALVREKGYSWDDAWEAIREINRNLLEDETERRFG